MDGPKKTSKRLSHDDYTVGWICPLEVEQIVAQEMLDEEHERLPQPANDHNVYTLGSINGHNVVIAGLPSTGNNPAATVVTQMRNTFTELRFGLLVGIGGGVPFTPDNRPIRLGHVVVSKPAGEHSGAVQYDHGKAEAGQFRRTGFLAPPPTVLLNAAQDLAVRRARSRTDPLVAHLSRIDTTIRGLRRYKYPGTDKDHLYRAEYIHREPAVSCQKCGCDTNQRVDRSSDDSDDEDGENEEEIVVHRGTIAAGELVVKDGLLRDKLAKQYGILCFEMEAAGALVDFPCLVVRGISDYSDSHKNDKWHGYAAATAAAYARQLFFHMPVDEVKKCGITESDVQQMIVDTSTLVQNSLEKDIKEWLKPPDTSAAYRNARDLHQAGTCHWFLASEIFKRWKEKHIPLIWIHGIPGSGKTILSSSIIEELKTKPHDPTDVVLYFYFGYETTADVTFDGMIRSFCAHLFPKKKKAQEALQRLYEENENGLPQTKNLVKSFESMVRHFNRVQIILDAPDEIKHRKDLDSLLQWITATAGAPKGPIQLIVTSRKDEDIESCMSSMGETVVLSRDVVKNDIKLYVEEQLRQSPKLQKWNGHAEAQKAIKLALIERSNGMFRWVFCQLDALHTCYNYGDLLSALKSLPQTLHETYTEILQRIPLEQRQRAITILQLLLFYHGTVSTGMVLDAIIVDPSRPPQRRAFDADYRFPEPRDLARICGALVTIEWDKIDPSSHEKPSGVFRIAHLSVREYLTSSDQVHPHFKNAFQWSVANVWLTQISLRYLRDIPANLEYEATMKEYSFAKIAVQWPDFAREQQQDESVAKAIKDFFADDKYQLFVRLYNRWDSIEKKHSDMSNGFKDHVLILRSLNLHDLFATATKNGSSWLLNHAPQRLPLGELRPSFWEFDPLASATSRNAVETIQRMKREESALYLAAQYGWSSVVRELLTRHIDVHTDGGDLGTALSAAMYFDKPDVVNMLQNHYDTLDPERFSSAVLNTLKSSAVYQDPLSHYKRLEPNGRFQGDLWMPLDDWGHSDDWRRYNGRLQSNDRLKYDDWLESDGPLKYKRRLKYKHWLKSDDWLQQALTRVVPSESDLSVVLKAALIYGREGLVEWSLTQGCSILSPGVICSTFVDASMFCTELCARNILGLVKDLQSSHLGEGHVLPTTQALVETCDEKYGRSALHWAAYRGFSHLTKDLLLDHANIHLKDRFGETALHCAAGQGETEIAQTLIDHGANTQDIDECFRTPVISAFEKCHLETCWAVSSTRPGIPSFQSMVHNIAINVEGWLQMCRDFVPFTGLTYYCSDLQSKPKRYNSSYSSEARDFLLNRKYSSQFQKFIVRELQLEQEGQLFVLARELHQYISSDKLERVRTLLYGPRGLEVLHARCPKDTMSTPLHRAAKKQSLEMFHLLLNAEANHSLRDQQGRTSLHILAEPAERTNEKIHVLGAFVKKGWKLDDPDNQGQTCFDLLQVQHECTDRMTCLHYAAQHGWTEVAKALLDAGADVGAQNIAGQTPLDYARIAHHLDVFGIRLDPLIGPSKMKHMTSPPETRLHEDRLTEPPKHSPSTIASALKLHKAVRLKDLGAVSELLETPDIDLSFVNLVDSAGRSALHWAVERKSHRLVQLLLEYGAIAKSEDYEGHIMPANYHANVKDDEGKTPLHCAAEAGEFKIVKTLVEGGAHAWALDGRGKTPQELATIGGSQAHREVADWLNAQAIPDWEDQDE